MSTMQVKQITLTIPDESVNSIQPFLNQTQINGSDFSILLDNQTIRRIAAVIEKEAELKKSRSV